MSTGFSGSFKFDAGGATAPNMFSTGATANPFNFSAAPAATTTPPATSAFSFAAPQSTTTTAAVPSSFTVPAGGAINAFTTPATAGASTSTLPSTSPALFANPTPNPLLTAARPQGNAASSTTTSSSTPLRPPVATSAASSALTVAQTDPAQTRDYFAENVRHHPLWSQLSFPLIHPTPVKAIPDPTSPTKQKDSATVQLSTPMESRLATSFSGALFTLAPPPTAASTSTLTHVTPSRSSAAPKCARLYYTDLKSLKTQHLKSHSDVDESNVPSYRELICTTPLPAHSHTIQLNSQATYAAVHSTNTVYFVRIAANKLEKAMMEKSQMSGINVESAAVGSWFHQNNTTLQILQVSFHPLSDIHLLILTNDSMLRIYNIKTNWNLPIKELNLSSVSQAINLNTSTAATSRVGSRKGSGASWSQASPNTSRSSGAAVKPMVTAFSFGSQPATRNAAVDIESNYWDLFTIYFLFSNGAITVLCPYIPPQVSLDRRLVIDMFRCEQTRLSELDTLGGSGDQSPAELEQIQARLMWLTQTFGHIDDANTLDAMDSGNFIVTRDPGTHEFAQGWIQPAQLCGAQSQVADKNSLAAPGAHTTTSSSVNGYPYPASHLIAFRHSGTQPPGRFFRGFVDGRLDLLMRLIPVRPFFATNSIRSLCEEVDDTASGGFIGGGFSSMSTNTALEELGVFFGTGGVYEQYSISSILLPADMSKLDGVELPIVAAPAANTIGGFSRSSLGLSPSLGRMNSQPDRNPSFTRVNSGAIPTTSNASPLTLFLPQYRPLIDLYDSAGMFIIAPHTVRVCTYGEQMDQISELLTRNDEDVLASVQSMFETMHSTQKFLTTVRDEKTRKIVGCVLINDPLLGKYLIHLSSTTQGASIVEVLELVRPQQQSMSVRNILQSADAAPAAFIPPQVRFRSTPAPPTIDPSTLDSSLVPFATEIAPFLARFRNFQPPAGFPAGIAGTADSLLNSPEALGEFLRIRKSYVETIHELTGLQQKIKSRLVILGEVGKEQQRLFQEVERDVVKCRAQQAALDERMNLSKELHENLSEYAAEVASAMSTRLTDLSPAELAWHQQLLSLQSATLPHFHHKLQALSSQSDQIKQIQQEMRQAERVDARKGITTSHSNTVWSDAQLAQIKPVLTNQSSAINSLVQQLSELHGTMSQLRSHSALQRPRTHSSSSATKANQLLLTQ